MLRVEIAENGFIVSTARHPGEIGKTYAFETADSLSEFVENWGMKVEGDREADKAKLRTSDNK